MVATDTPEKEAIKQPKDASSFMRKQEAVKKDVFRNMPSVNRKLLKVQSLIKLTKKRERGFRRNFHHYHWQIVL